MLGAAWVADRAVLPAIAASANGHLVAIASRDPDRASELAGRHGTARAFGTYEEVLADPGVEAVYIPLINSLHLPWTLRALEAGKHVLCEKPLAMNAAEGGQMAASAQSRGLLLMEALMYRFHPRMRRLRASEPRPLHLQASFSFRLDAPGNYRLEPVLGGGALLDVGSYTISAARWFLGEPERVEAVATIDRVDLSVAAVLGYQDGATASLWASLQAPEHQELLLINSGSVRRVETPFTAWRDPDDPYQLMVEAFASAALSGRPAPLPPEDSIANLRVLDRVRAAAAIPVTLGGVESAG